MVAIIVMGVCGSGKTTIGKAIAEKVSCPFKDADTFHSSENVQKMSQGIPLTDKDRLPWLSSLHEILYKWVRSHDDKTSSVVCGVLACSALKKSYRNHLTGKANDDCGTAKATMNNITKQCLFVYLHGPSEVISKRMKDREDHYMPSSLLQSQLTLLEEPLQTEEHCLWCDITDNVTMIVDKILNYI